MIENQIGLDAATLTRLLGVLVPLLVAAITKKYASAGLKGFLNLLASVLVGSFAYLVAEDGGYDWTGFVNGSLDTFMTSIIAYYGVLKPTGLAGSVTNATKDFGLGSPPSFETDDKGAEDAGDQPRDASGRFKSDKGESPLYVIGLILAVVGGIILVVGALNGVLSVPGLILLGVGAVLLFVRPRV